MAKQQIVIDEERVGEMAYCQCSNATIARVIGISERTLRGRCAQLLLTKRAEGKAAIRAAQFKQALAGDRAMLVWLGKQYLGQADRRDITTAGEPVKLYGVGTKIDKV